MLTSRLVDKVVPARDQLNIEGAKVRESVGSPELGYCDPFLILKETEAEFPAGFPSHPHRGFETVCYILSGSLKVEDSLGHTNILSDGDVQWLTAGRGVVHSEIPHPRVHGILLWVNLSAKNKMIPPRNQELIKSEVPVVEKNGVRIALIAGKSMNVESPMQTLTPTTFLDITLSPWASYHQPIPSNQTSLAYTLSGTVTFGDSQNELEVKPHSTVIFSKSGDQVAFKNQSEETARFVLISGEPLNEPCAHYGPFVMNSKEEIDETFKDYKRGTNGFEHFRERKQRLMQSYNFC